MKNFDWTQFSKRIAVKVPMATIYNAWAVPSEIEKWFLKTARYKNLEQRPIPMDQQIEPDLLYEWTWYLYDETEYGTITKANGTDHIQFTFARQCLVDIHLTEQHGYTIVDLKQTNIPTDDDAKENIRLGCSSGWSFYFVNLKSVYEGGLDLRSKDERLRPMVNN
ncbi:MAG: SRPBCC domain-containing protein [Bacteroidetes bacterium]|nr:SRPBCC domain-containing protein [Bacteroidota bacterium]